MAVEKTIAIHVPIELYERVERAARRLGLGVSPYCSSILFDHLHDDDMQRLRRAVDEARLREDAERYGIPPS